MKRELVSRVATLPVLAIAAVVSFGQQTQSVTQSSIIVKQRTSPQEVTAQKPAPDNLIFVASEFSSGGKVVKGAPYSAEAVTETIQTLGDGNRIINRVSSAQYRDSEGRTRREQTIKMLGSLGDGGEPLRTVFIHDPIAGVTYSLDSRTNTAHKSAPLRGTWTSPVGSGGTAGQRFEFRIESAPAAGVLMKTPMEGPPPAAPDPTTHSVRVHAESGAGGSYVFRRTGSSENEVKEQLGKQSFEGVEAEGTRTTVTIPAGEIGNERAIQIVSERWFSPELQMVVMTRHSDPRSGETTYRLTNINRAEPDKSLFEVPAGYTVKEGLGGTMTTLPIPARRKPE